MGEDVRLKFIAVLTAALAIAATAHAAGSDKYAGIQSVGIISAIGDWATMRKLSETMGQDASAHAVYIASWNLDDLVAARIASQISPRFSTKPLSYDKAAFLHVTPDSIFDSYKARLKSLILALPAGNAVDAYVVVRKAYADSAIGIVRDRTMLGVMDQTTLSAFYEIDVVDAKTGDVIGVGQSHLGSGFLGKMPPTASGDNSYWSDSQPSPEQLQALLQAVLPLVYKTIPYTLYQADLITDAPPDQTDTDQAPLNPSPSAPNMVPQAGGN